VSSEQAEQLSKFLTHSDGYGRKSPLVQRVETGISAMTAEIANEVIAENPELRDVIRRKTREVINRALNDDTYLNSTITKAIAEALTRHALDQD